MRIVILSDTAIADGGAEILSIAMARGLAGRGCAVTFVAADDSANPALADVGVTVENLGVARVGGGAGARALVPALYNPNVRARLRRRLRERDDSETIYHVHAWSKALSPAVFAALAPAAARTFVHAHDFFLVCPNANFYNFTAERMCGRTPLSPGCIVAACSKRHALDKAWRVTRGAILRGVMDAKRWRLLLIHEAMRSRFLDGGFDDARIAALPNPSDPFTPEPVDAAANRSFLFVGRLSKEKGPDLACAAAAAAGVPLVLAGEGEMRAALEAAYPQFTFAGWTDKAGLEALAGDARALLMTSRSPEPFGLAAAEALGSGLPVVAADTALLARDLEALGCGTAVPAADTDAVARTLSALADDDALVARMSAAARAAYRTVSPSFDDWIDALIAAYEGALSSAAGGDS